MTTSFPTSLDTFTNPTSTNVLADSTPKHSLQHSNLNDAVLALEAKVGVDASLVNTSIDYTIKRVVTDATNATLSRSGAGPYTLGINLANGNTWTGQQIFNSAAAIFGIGVVTPKIYPAADGSSAVQILKADGATKIVTVDTTNSRVLIGSGTPPTDFSVGLIGLVKEAAVGLSTVLTRMRERTAGDDFAVSVNINDSNTQDNAAKASWVERFGPGTDTWGIYRSPAGSSTLATIIKAKSNGYVGVGITNPAVHFHLSDADVSTNSALLPSGLVFFSTAQTANNDFYLITANNTESNFFAATRARGTLASPTAVAANDQLGAFIFNYYNGSTTQYLAAHIRASMDSNNSRADLILGAGNSGSSGINRFWIKGSDGAIGNLSAPLYPFHITGNAYFDSKTRFGYNDVNSASLFGTVQVISAQNTALAVTFTQSNVATGVHGFKASSSVYYIGADGGTIAFMSNPTLAFSGTEVARIDLNNTRFGVGVTPLATGHFQSTTEQLRVGYDASNYYKTTVGSTGGVTLDAVGSGAGFTFSDQITGSAGYVGSDLTASKPVFTDSGKKLVSGAFSVPQIVASGNVTGQSAANTSIATYTTPNDSTVHSFRIGGYVAITAISAGTLTFQATFTDENGNAQTQSFFPMGLTSAGLTSTGFDAFPDANIRCNPNTAITLKTTFTGVSITYDAGGTVESLY